MSGDLDVGLYMILVDHRSSELWNVRDLVAVIDCTDSTPGYRPPVGYRLDKVTGTSERERAACAQSDWT